MAAALDSYDLRRRATGPTPSWHDAHSPLHTRELLYVPIAGTVLRLHSALAAELAEPADRRRLPALPTIRARIISTPVRLGLDLPRKGTDAVCLPEDSVILELLAAGAAPITVTARAADLDLPSVPIGDPVPKGKLRTVDSSPTRGTSPHVPGDGLADLCAVLGQAARRAARKLTGRR